MDLNVIKGMFLRLANKIGLPEKYWPHFTQNDIDEGESVQLDSDSNFIYKIFDHGREMKKVLISDVDELLYIIMVNATYRLAINYELERRVPNADSRRQIFFYQEELMQKLDKIWLEKVKKEHQEILKKHPFDDWAVARANYSKKLTDAGKSLGEAWDLALVKYPIPE